MTVLINDVVFTGNYIGYVNFIIFILFWIQTQTSEWNWVYGHKIGIETNV